MRRFEQDTIKRQIRQLGDMIAAIVARVRVDHDYETGLEAIRKASEMGLGPDRAVLDRLAPGSAAMMLRDDEAVRAYASICSEEAELLTGLGRSHEAEARRHRALELYGLVGGPLAGNEPR